MPPSKASALASQSRSWDDSAKTLEISQLRYRDPFSPFLAVLCGIRALLQTDASQASAAQAPTLPPAHAPAFLIGNHPFRSGIQ